MTLQVIFALLRLETTGFLLATVAGPAALKRREKEKGKQAAAIDIPSFVFLLCFGSLLAEVPRVPSLASCCWRTVRPRVSTQACATMDVDDAQTLIERRRGDKSFFEIDFDTLNALGVEVADIVEALGRVPTINHVTIWFRQALSQADTRRLLDFVQSRNPLVKLSLGFPLGNNRQVVSHYIESALSNQSLQTLRLSFCPVSVHLLVHLLRVGCPVQNLEFDGVYFEKSAVHDLDTTLFSNGDNELKKLSFNNCTFGSLNLNNFQLEADRESFNIFDSCWKDPSVRKPTVEIGQMSRISADFPFGATIASSVENLYLNADCDPGSFDTILAAGKAKIKILSVELGTNASDFDAGQRPGWTVDEKCNHLANAIPEMKLEKLTVTLRRTQAIDTQVWKRRVRRLMKAIAKNVIKTIKLEDKGNLLTEKEKQEFEGLGIVVAELDRKLVPDLLGLFGDGSPSALFKAIRASAEAGDNGIFPLSVGRGAPPTDGA